MSVHHKFLEPLFPGEEFLANPKQIFFALHLNRNAGSNTGMHKQKFTTTETGIESFEKLQMSFGYGHGQFFGQLSLFESVRINRWHKSVGYESFETAALPPFIE